MKTNARLGWLATLLFISPIALAEPSVPSTNTVRVAAAQAARRIIDFHLRPDEALTAVDKNLAELERIVNRAGEAKCDVLVLPEDTLGLLNWVGANETLVKEVLPKAVKRMLERLGSAAARHHMYLVVCSDCSEGDGGTYNTSFFLGRDGQEIGRYHKVCPTWGESGARQRGDKFPVFTTPDLGTAGMLICYDLVVPETARCLALQGADIIFFPTMGGAAIGDDDIGVQALRVRAAENFIWLVVAQRGSDAMVISPQGKIVAKADDPDVLFADNFESGDMKKWDQQRGRVVMIEDKPNSGRWCVQMPMERGRNHGGDAIKWFMPGADTVYARLYVKFSSDYQYNHHFVWLGANQRTNKWSAFGKAGLRPDGTYYSTGMEPWFAWGKNPPPGEVNLYTYYLDMEKDPKMDKYWGNGFFPPGPGKGKQAAEGRVVPPLDRWQCWEFMIQANSAPDKADGRQAMWVDGKLIGDFTGIRWRRDPDLKVNCFWLEHYGYDESDPTRQFSKDRQAVWFDDVVV